MNDISPADDREPSRIVQRFGVSIGTLSVLIAQTIAITAWLVSDHSRILSLTDVDARLEAKIDYIDANGARVVVQRLGQLDSYVIANNRQIELLQKRIDDERNARNSEERTEDKLQAQIDLLRQESSRIIEQQSRLIQALDNTYNLLQEHLRNHPSNNKERGPPNLNLER